MAFTFRLNPRIDKMAELIAAKHGLSKQEFCSAAVLAAINSEPDNAVIHTMAGYLLGESELTPDLRQIVGTD